MRMELKFFMIVTAFGLLAACAVPEARLRAGLVNAGLSEPMAACMAERMVDRLSLTQLRRIGDLPYARDERTVRGFLHRVRSLRDPEILAVSTSCGGALRGAAAGDLNPSRPSRLRVKRKSAHAKNAKARRKSFPRCTLYVLLSG